MKFAIFRKFSDFLEPAWLTTSAQASGSARGAGSSASGEGATTRQWN
jgi:hypothetical protein